MNYSDKVITMKSGEKYIVVEQVDFENRIFLYLINKNNEDDSMFVEIKDEQILEIDSDLFKEKILPLFVKKIQVN